MTALEIFNIIMAINIILTILVVILDNRDPETSLTWIILLLFLPVVGLFFFLMAGINWKKRKLTAQNPEELFNRYFGNVIEGQRRFIKISEEKNEMDNDRYKLINLLLKANRSVLTTCNHCRIFTNGGDFFSNLLEDLETARHSIHMEFFIWKSDNIGNRIKDVLIRKASEGVNVRLIFDGVGSLGRISRKYRNELRDAGVEFRYFHDLSAPMSVFRINYSNHRKIAIIDGDIAYTGGMNVGDEYIDGGRFGHWRDTQIRVTGENIYILQGIFITDWKNSNGSFPVSEAYFPDPEPENEDFNSYLPMQYAISGADSQWDAIQKLYFTMITNANREICIQTPYFIPDKGLMNALISAALGGAEVKLMITGVPDKRIPFWAAHTYFEPLLRAGVEIYLYKKGFLHAKSITVDRELTSVGSCNMDMRSFHINYEINTMIYDIEKAVEMTEIFNDDLKLCMKVTDEYLESLSFFAKLRNSFFRLLSPLM